jgi:gas vesicle protein GvpA/GvpJ/GvpM family
VKRRPSPPPPPHVRRHSTVSRRTSHTTVPARPPVIGPAPPRPRIPPVARTAAAYRAIPPSKRRAAAIIDEDEGSLLDVIDNLLNKGVVINADVILALADVDLIYLRLSALLCAADRIWPR